MLGFCSHLAICKFVIWITRISFHAPRYTHHRWLNKGKLTQSLWNYDVYLGLLIHFTDACSGWGQEPRAQSRPLMWVAEIQWISQHLLPPWICIVRKMESVAEAKKWVQGNPTYALTRKLQICPLLKLSECLSNSSHSVHLQIESDKRQPATQTMFPKAYAWVQEWQMAVGSTTIYFPEGELNRCSIQSCPFSVFFSGAVLFILLLLF